MSLELITGPHQSGKTRRLWERLRGEPLGTAVLVRPQGGLPHDLVRSVHGWFGAGLLPPVLGLADLIERCAAGVGDGTRALGVAAAGHVLRAWTVEGLRGEPWGSLAGFRASGRELADICLRLDDHLIGDDDLDAAARRVRSDDPRLAEGILRLVAARRHLARVARGRGQATPGRRLQALAAAAAAPADIGAIYLDDLMALTPAELALIASLARVRRVVVAAVDDRRLGPGGLAERLRRAFPGAGEERLPGMHARAPHAAALRGLLAGALLDDHPLPLAAAGHYAYRDPTHGGRAIAAWLRREGIAPGDATVYVRVADGEALALADALIAADVPVVGRFSIPFAGTAAGGVLIAAAAFARAPTWAAFLALAERVGARDGLGSGVWSLRWSGVGTAQRGDVAADSDPGPRTPDPGPRTGAMLLVRLPDLLGPWGALSCDEGLARVAMLVSDGQCDGWGWSERDAQRPWLASALAWLTALRGRLRTAGAENGRENRKDDGERAADEPRSWAERFARIVAALDLDDADSGVLVQLEALGELHPLSAEDANEIIAAARVAVVRGDPGGAAGALVIADAVRARTWPRPVAFIHGLEHGRWPGAVPAGALLANDDRRRLAALLGDSAGSGRDVFDEHGRAAGEIGSLLAVMARATRLVVVGIPCGEREPAAWLAVLAGQVGWTLERVRADPGRDAVPGAPLGPADSQGAHERALWNAVPGRPDFTFAIPPRAPERLGLRISALNALHDDSFAAVCARLALGIPLADLARLDEGRDLHGVLARLAGHAPMAWPTLLAQLLPDWIASGADALERTARERVGRMVREAMADESAAVPPGTACHAEQDVVIHLPVPGHDPLVLHGRIDRLDRLAHGAVRVVDYKRGAIAGHAAQVRDGRDGQLLAYLAGLRAAGERVDSGYYLGLRDGRRSGYGVAPASKRSLGADPAVIDERLDALGQAIAVLAGGTAVASTDGTSARDYAPIARLDEARHDLGGPDDDGEPAGASS